MLQNVLLDWAVDANWVVLHLKFKFSELLKKGKNDVQIFSVRILSLFGYMNKLMMKKIFFVLF